MRDGDDRDPARTGARGEALAALGVFAAMCVAVLVRAPRLLEPDDLAYRASIVALSEGHLVLTNAQFTALFLQLSRHGGLGIAQWTHLANGNWVSQKNPGYPFLAVAFQWLHALRLAPLFYGALACAGLFYGARRWLGPRGGLYAVALYCTSGAALLFAWRPTIETYTDASLAAAGCGVLLGVLLSPEDPPARRAALGALGFVALDLAVLTRYTDAVILVVALVAVLVLARAAGLARSAILAWLGVVGALGVAVLGLDDYLYGAPLSTGYAPGLIRFAASAVGPNLEHMPSRLVESMPVCLVAAGGALGVAVVAWRRRARGLDRGPDAVVALVLAAAWLAVWGLYAAYTWTVAQASFSSNPLHVVRFYVPALGLMALLGAWLLARLPRWAAAAVIVALAGFGLWSYLTPANTLIVHRAPVGPVSAPVGGRPAGPPRPVPAPSQP